MNALGLLTCLALAQSPATFDAKKLDQVIALAGPQKAAAEKALRAEPRTAGPLLSFTVRVGGPSALQDVLREQLKCPMMMGMGPMRPEPGPAKAAAALLVSIAATDEEVRLQLATSGYGLDKILAIVAVWDDEEALQKLSTQLETPALDDTERRMINALRQCSLMMTMQQRTRPTPSRTAALEKLAHTTSKRGTCDDEKGAAALIEAGPFQVRGWGSSGEEFHFNLEANGVATSANPTCLFATYPPLHLKGDGSEVLVPLAESHSPLEKQALALLQRDLESYPKEPRRKALKLLLSRGLLLEKLSEFGDDERRHDSALMRPWLLSGDAAAQAHLLSKLACPFVSEDVPALTVLKDRKVALLEAKRLAATCPRARGAALAVLHELKDPRWLESAPLALADPFAKNDFERALKAAWSPAVKAQLLAVPSKDAAWLAWREAWISRTDRTVH